MKLKTISNWLFSASLCAPTVSHAVIIEGSFSGTVVEVGQSYDEDSTFTYWNGDITGQSISGTFWYDTALPKNTLSGTSTASASYTAEQKNWIGMIFNIDGKTFDVSNLNPQELPPYYVQDYLTIRHSEPTSTDDEPQLTIYDSIERDLGFGGGVSLQGKITLGNAASTILNGINLEQEFSWINQGATDTGVAEFMYHNSVGGLYANTWVTMSLSEVHTKISDRISVPEPSSLGLLALGLLVLGWRKGNSA